MASEGYKVVVAPDGKRYAVSNPARKSGCSGRLSNLLCFLFLAVLGLGGYFLYTQTDALDWLEDLLFGGEEDTSPIGPIGEEIRGNNGTDYIGIIFVEAATENEQAPYIAAAEKWSKILAGNDYSGAGSAPTLSAPFLRSDVICSGIIESDGFTFEAGTVDHMIILIENTAIDGPGGILGRAGPCDSVAQGPILRPFIGGMKFDADDNINEDVAFHEIGHTLGIGTRWSAFLDNPQSGCNGGVTITECNPTFTGDFGKSAYGGLISDVATDVPVEDGFVNGVNSFATQTGSIDSHWSKEVFETEVMTYSLGASAYLSNLTITHMRDLGYIVNDTFAEPPPTPVNNLFLRGSVSSTPTFDLTGDAFDAEAYRKGNTNN